MLEQKTRDQTTAFDCVTDLLKCKWTLKIFDALEQGINRPGRLERALPGLTTKVLNERLRKLERYGLIEKQVFAELPPRVEYHLTRRGYHFAKLLNSIRLFAEEWGCPDG